MLLIIVGYRSVRTTVTDLSDDKPVLLLQISRVPVQSCQVYDDCAECVTTKDPLNCGWCGDHCSTNSECLSSVWHEDSCPPRIYSVRSCHINVTYINGTKPDGFYCKVMSYSINYIHSNVLAPKCLLMDHDLFNIILTLSV